MRYLLLFLLFGPGVSAEEIKPSFEWHLFGDSYYSYNFNQPPSVAAPNAASVNAAAIPNGQNAYRYYDSFHNQITINLAELSVVATYQDVSVLVDFDFGPFADMNATSSSNSGKTVDEVSKHLGQAVFTYKPSGSQLTFEIGKMYSHLGAETAKSKDNFNYSRTILFSYGIPFWHTGLHIGCDIPSEKLQANAYFYNGWNSLYANNTSKTVGAELKYTPSALFTITYNYLGGPAAPGSESTSKVLHEIVSSWTFDPKWSALTDLLAGRNFSAKWYGGFVALKYQLTERSYLSPRYEIFRDQNGFAISGPVQTINSATLTYGHSLVKGFDLRGEGRWDSSSVNPFTKGLVAKHSQTTLLAAAMFAY